MGELVIDLSRRFKEEPSVRRPKVLQGGEGTAPQACALLGRRRTAPFPGRRLSQPQARTLS